MISNLKKGLILMLVLAMTAVTSTAWAGIRYEWTGAAGNNQWATLGNWNHPSGSTKISDDQGNDVEVTHAQVVMGPGFNRISDSVSNANYVPYIEYGADVHFDNISPENPIELRFANPSILIGGITPSTKPTVANVFELGSITVENNANVTLTMVSWNSGTTYPSMYTYNLTVETGSEFTVKDGTLNVYSNHKIEDGATERWYITNWKQTDNETGRADNPSGTGVGIGTERFLGSSSTVAVDGNPLEGNFNDGSILIITAEGTQTVADFPLNNRIPNSVGHLVVDKASVQIGKGITATSLSVTEGASVKVPAAGSISLGSLLVDNATLSLNITDNAATKLKLDEVARFDANEVKTNPMPTGIEGGQVTFADSSTLEIIGNNSSSSPFTLKITPTSMGTLKVNKAYVKLPESLTWLSELEFDAENGGKVEVAKTKALGVGGTSESPAWSVTAGESNAATIEYNAEGYKLTGTDATVTIAGETFAIPANGVIVNGDGTTVKTVNTGDTITVAGWGLKADQVISLVNDNGSLSATSTGTMKAISTDVTTAEGVAVDIFTVDSTYTVELTAVNGTIAGWAFADAHDTDVIVTRNDDTAGRWILTAKSATNNWTAISTPLTITSAANATRTITTNADASEFGIAETIDVTRTRWTATDVVVAYENLNYTLNGSAGVFKLVALSDFIVNLGTGSVTAKNDASAITLKDVTLDTTTAFTTADMWSNGASVWTLPVGTTSLTLQGAITVETVPGINQSTSNAKVINVISMESEGRLIDDGASYSVNPTENSKLSYDATNHKLIITIAKAEKPTEKPAENTTGSGGGDNSGGGGDSDANNTEAPSDDTTGSTDSSTDGSTDSSTDDTTGSTDSSTDDTTGTTDEGTTTPELKPEEEGGSKPVAEETTVDKDTDASHPDSDSSPTNVETFYKGSGTAVEDVKSDAVLNLVESGTATEAAAPVVDLSEALVAAAAADETVTVEVLSLTESGEGTTEPVKIEELKSETKAEVETVLAKADVVDTTEASTFTVEKVLTVTAAEGEKAVTVVVEGGANFQPTTSGAHKNKGKRVIISDKPKAYPVKAEKEWTVGTQKVDVTTGGYDLYSIIVRGAQIFKTQIATTDSFDLAKAILGANDEFEHYFLAVNQGVANAGVARIAADTDVIRGPSTYVSVGGGGLSAGTIPEVAAGKVGEQQTFNVEWISNFKPVTNKTDIQDVEWVYRKVGEADVKTFNTGIFQAAKTFEEEGTYEVTATAYKTGKNDANSAKASAQFPKVEIKPADNAGDDTTAPSDSGGGCAAGFMGMALLLAVPMFMKKR